MAATVAAEARLSKVEKAHQLYRDGRYHEALELYTDALAMAKGKAPKIALHSNRAACFLKLHDFKKAADECTSVLELDQKHSGALMLRAQTLVTQREYQSALFDVNRLLEINPSSEVYLNFQCSLKTQLSLAPIPESEAELEEDDEDEWMEKKPQGDEEYGEEPQNGEVVSAESNKNGNPQETAPSDHKSLPLVEEKRHEGSSADDKQRNGWGAIPKPRGHSKLDYSRWDRVENDSSEEEEEEDDTGSGDEDEPRCRFRVKSIGVKPVK